MSGFTGHWLELREPADIAARGASLISKLTASLSAKMLARVDGNLSVVDLGAGTGSNFRHLAPGLGHGQHWCLVDHDETLIKLTQKRLESWAPSVSARIETIAGGWRVNAPDFSATLQTLTLDLSTGLDQLPWHQTDLLTGSALLDLVSQSWLVSLAGHCQRHQCLALFALTYDGRMQWHPREPHDESVTEALNRHQQQDKGFGLAMGPLAAQASVDCFEAHGFAVQQIQTDWDLGPESMELQRELTTGIARAIAGPGAPGTMTNQQIDRWLAERLAHLGREQARLTVGHLDWLAIPASS